MTCDAVPIDFCEVKIYRGVAIALAFPPHKRAKRRAFFSFCNFFSKVRKS